MSFNLNKGLQLFDNQDFESSIQFFTKAISEQPDNIEALNSRALAYAKLNQFPQAFSDFQKAINLAPNNAKLFSDRALVYHFMDNKEKSLADFDKAIELEPDNPYRYASRAFIKDRWGDLTGALADYDKAIALDPEDAISINNKGMVEEKMGYKQQANKSFKYADELSGILKDRGIDRPSPDLSKIKSNQPKTNIPYKAKISEPSNVSVKQYLNVLRNTLTKKEEFKSFMAFCKGIFNKNK